MALPARSPDTVQRKSDFTGYCGLWRVFSFFLCSIKLKGADRPSWLTGHADTDTHPESVKPQVLQMYHFLLKLYLCIRMAVNMLLFYAEKDSFNGFSICSMQ